METGGRGSRQKAEFMWVSRWIPGRQERVSVCCNSCHPKKPWFTRFVVLSQVDKEACNHPSSPQTQLCSLALELSNLASSHSCVVLGKFFFLIFFFPSLKSLSLFLVYKIGLIIWED